LGFHFWPEWSYVLGRRIDFLSPTLFVSDILLAGTVLFWLAEYLLNNKSIKGLVLSIRGLVVGIKGIKFSFTLLYLILFPLFIYLNTTHAVSRPVAFYSWVKFFEYALLFYYIVKTKPSMRLLSIGVTIGMLYSSGIAIGQFLLQHSLGGIFWFLGERTFTVDTPGIARFPLCLPSIFGCIEFLRSYATFPHPNVLGGYLAVGIPIILQNQKSKIKNQIDRYQKEKIDVWLEGVRNAAIILGLIAVAVTFSRSAALVVVLYGLFRVIQLFIFDKVKLLNTELGILNTVFGIRYSVFKKATILFVILLFFVGLYVLKNMSLLDESVVVRQDLMVSSLKLFQSAPLLGIGLGNFIVRLPDVLTAHAVYFLQPVHNIYLLLLSEIGIAGVFLLLLFGFYLLNQRKLKIKYQISNIQIKNIHIFFTLHYPLFVILVLGLVDHYWLTLQQGQLLLVMILGFSVVQLKE
jgi:hypothetical protein